MNDIQCCITWRELDSYWNLTGSFDLGLYEVLILSQYITCSRWPSALLLCGEYKDNILIIYIYMEHFGDLQTAAYLCIGIWTFYSWVNLVPKERAIWWKFKAPEMFKTSHTLKRINIYLSVRSLNVNRIKIQFKSVTIYLPVLEFFRVISSQGYKGHLCGNSWPSVDTN